MKQVAGQLRLELAQFRALAAFAQFGSELDTATRAQLERGLRLTELLKQPQYQPLSLEDQILSVYALTKGFGGAVPVDQIGTYASNLLKFMHANYPAIGQAIANEKVISEQTDTALWTAVAEYNRSLGYEVPNK